MITAESSESDVSWSCVTGRERLSCRYGHQLQPTVVRVMTARVLILFLQYQNSTNKYSPSLSSFLSPFAHWLTWRTVQREPVGPLKSRRSRIAAAFAQLLLVTTFPLIPYFVSFISRRSTTTTSRGTGSVTVRAAGPLAMGGSAVFNPLRSNYFALAFDVADPAPDPPARPLSASSASLSLPWSLVLSSLQFFVPNGMFSHALVAVDFHAVGPNHHRGDTKLQCFPSLACPRQKAQSLVLAHSSCHRCRTLQPCRR